MKTPANIAKHPIHPMLVAIPIGLWLFSLACDLAWLLTGADPWRLVALYTMAGGIVGALMAAVPGFIDMLSLSAPLKRIALTHMTINLAVVGLYAFNTYLRWDGSIGLGVVALSALAVAMLGVSGWLGGKMVYVHGVAVDTEPPPAATRATPAPKP